MLGCKLQGKGCGCTQHAFSSRSRPISPIPSQTLRCHTLASATAFTTLTKANDSVSSSIVTLSVEPLSRRLAADEPAIDDESFALSSAASATNAAINLQPRKSLAKDGQRLSLDSLPHRLTAVESSTNGHSFAASSFINTAANADPNPLLRGSPAEEGQRLLAEVLRRSAEILRLEAELRTEMTAFLAATSDLTLTQTPAPTQEQLQQQQQQQQQPSQSPATPRSQPPPHQPQQRRQASSSRSSSSSRDSSGALDGVFDPLALAGAPASADRPTGLTLPSLSLPAVGAASGEAASAGLAAGAGSRAERRRQNWRRGAAAAPAAAAPAHEAKYKTYGSGSMTILMGSFSKDHILSAQEEQLLASAAQDFMRLDDLTRLLAAVLRRPPSLREMAQSLQCEESALRVRLDCGSRARTLLAQKNYRLVVNIAKRMLRSGGGGGGGAAASGGGGGGAAGAGGGAAAAGGGGSGQSLGDGGASLDDAITVGMEALMHAIRKFKPEAGYRLSTYATWWIRLHVSRLVQAQAGVITMSVYQRINVDRVRAARAKLRSQLPPGVQPSPQQVAEAAGLSPFQVTQVESMERTFAVGARSFEAPLADGELTVEDMVAQDDDAELSEGSGSSLFLDSEDFAASASLASTVEGLLASLDRGEAEALRKEFGLEQQQQDGGLAGDAAAMAAAAASGVSSGGKAPAVKPGAERLKLGRNHRQSAAKALEKLRLSSADDPRLAEWLGLRSTKSSSLPVRTPGYAKKSR
ncbi:hypothetical protein PLESTB_000452900 [Pleodorina starrii]|uniref:RNA polymerase sigma-70 region 2 domain-containing protein n=1 Tax=Pleodorina starrii TaxID=330485 RepID=A0A9W6BFU0_9CHLO|nr:hypothetical protein PLESTM_000754300 [Pleodorina starrii]GLC50978.1 hypothetical protein PLESTB_000452900 [Pleodorina starrii]